MHPVLEQICIELDSLVAYMKQTNGNGTNPFGRTHNNWTFPGLDGTELIEKVEELASDIRARGTDILSGNADRIQAYPDRVRFLREQTVPNLWGNANAGVSAFLATLEGLRNAVEPSLQPLDNVLQADAIKARRAAERLRGLEARLTELSPRADQLTSMVQRIESAHDVADQLPADIASLQEAKRKLTGAIEAAEKEGIKAHAARENAEASELALKVQEAEAIKVLAKCEAAYSAATSQGLAAAFAERSIALEKSILPWIVGLVCALLVGAIIGVINLNRLLELVKTPNIASATVWLNTMLSIVSVAAPVWLAWLSTKQIGHRFRLAEDYAFKASVSRAYEGYRKEAARIDPIMEARLLSSALDRLDEQPLRLVESDTHGSPWHELLNSDTVTEATKKIPGFAETTFENARKALEALAGRSGKLETNVHPIAVDSENRA